MIKQAVILAGGEGTRLKPVTEKIPKPMVEINNKPFLEYQLELLAANGFTDIVLLVGYLWEKINDYFGNSFKSRSGAKLTLKYSVEHRFLGTGGAVKNAELLLDDFFFVLYGDTYLPIEYQVLGKILFENDVTGVVTVYSNADKIVDNNIRVNGDGYVSEFNKQRPTATMNGIEAGATVYRKRLLNYLPKTIPENQKISLEVDIYPKLITQKQLLGYMTNIRYYDMGTFDRIKIISEVLK